MLTDKQILALNLMVYEGMIKKEAAEAVGVVPETISAWFRSQEFSRMHDELIHARLKEISDTATNRLHELINDEQSSTALGAVKLAMSLGGFDAVVKSEVTQKTIVIGVEDANTDNTKEGDI